MQSTTYRAATTAQRAVSYTHLVLFPEPGSSAPLWLACVSNGISVGIGELISCPVLLSLIHI